MVSFKKRHLLLIGNLYFLHQASENMVCCFLISLISSLLRCSLIYEIPLIRDLICLEINYIFAELIISIKSCGIVFDIIRLIYLFCLDIILNSSTIVYNCFRSTWFIPLNPLHTTYFSLFADLEVNGFTICIFSK